VACGSSHDAVPAADAGHGCVMNLDANCSPLYAPPIYATIFDKIFHPTCAQGIGTCHTADAAMGGLVFEDAGTAYALLLGTQGGRARVLPGNPSCSLLVEKLESNDPNFRMPPGPMPLLEAARCDIEQWIAQGAQP
jgi:Planctomycete cytochrome C